MFTSVISTRQVVLGQQLWVIEHPVIGYTMAELSIQHAEFWEIILAAILHQYDSKKVMRAKLVDDAINVK